MEKQNDVPKKKPQKKVQKEGEKVKKKRKTRGKKGKKSKKGGRGFYPMMSILHSQSRTINFKEGNSLHEGKIEAKLEKGKKAKWIPFYARISKNKLLSFYTDIHSFSPLHQFDLMDAAYERKEGFIAKITITKPETVKLLIRAKTNLLYEDWIKYLNLKEKTKKRKTKKKSNFGFGDFNDTRFKDELFSKVFIEWTTEEVLKWLSYIKINYDETCFDRYGHYFKQSQINGSLLQEFFLKERKHLDQILSSLGIKDPLHQAIVTKEIVALEDTGTFDVTPFVVQNKVEKMFLKHLSGKKGEKKIQKTFKEFLEYCMHFHDENLMFRTIKFILTKLESIKRGKKTYKVKFIITENLQDWRIKQVRKFLGVPLSVANKMGLTDIKFGMFHAAFAIGPLQVEWVDNSLCLIRSISSENVILCVDVGFVTTKDVEDFALNLTRVCRKWNRDYTYETINIKNKKFHANCQQFVEYFIIGHLGLRLEFSSEIQQYLKNLTEKGRTKMMFSYDSEFAEKFGLKASESPFVPCNHVELDDFVSSLKKICPNFEKEFPGKFELLKGFDRAFWLRHLSQMKSLGKKDVDFKSLYSPSPNGCPFNTKKEK